MGIAKSHWMEVEARGWYDPDKSVCPDCVEDDYLKSEIQANFSSTNCDYCGRSSGQSIAAPIRVVLKPIAEALFRHYGEPAQAGLPWDEGEYVGGRAIVDTSEALENLEFERDEKLFDDISDAFLNDAWYPCAHGYWLDTHEHEELIYGWQRFEEETKHRARYFFPQVKGSSTPGERYSPGDILNALGRLVDSSNLHKALNSNDALYRAREISLTTTVTEFDEIGPPPNGLAAAGRMNPAGISYFYAGLEKNTALAEVLGRPPCRAALGKFCSNRDLLVLDLSSLPDIPSIFDSAQAALLDELIFMRGFVAAISEPVSKNGREDIDYVPSQIVCEYFSKVFKTKKGQRIDGIIYPSAIKLGGRNIVLFPSRDGLESWQSFLELHDLSHHYFENWHAFRPLT